MFNRDSAAQFYSIKRPNGRHPCSLIFIDRPGFPVARLHVNSSSVNLSAAAIKAMTHQSQHMKRSRRPMASVKSVSSAGSLIQICPIAQPPPPISSHPDSQHVVIHSPFFLSALRQI
ncbi:hypothetical protein F2P81_005559 [Scophthalmus maximus]|uniref:Uncharacterized protein n=1 Tax=Scophthalmus maximus TaxID=52904 RepID=A0A6A4T6Y9_SCOMX|nr:hypothetical protein F2P81_005559 [Scophthalmus maximus]